MSNAMIFAHQGPRYDGESALEAKARRFASAAHEMQVRKYTGEPYIYHPAEVADMVRTVRHTSEMLAAAWLHDVIEDCNVRADTIQTEFGGLVCILVCQLTDYAVLRDGNRTKRAEINRAHTAMALIDAKTVKLADIISNSKSILAHDPNFSKIYLPEKRALLYVLKAGDPTLWAEADRICREAGY